MGKNRNKIFGVIAVFFLFGLSVAYQNCGSGQGGSLNIGDPKNSILCTYGINQQTGACNSAPVVNAAPTYYCTINNDTSRCTNTSNCILACGETINCYAKSNVASPNDSLVGCEDSSTNCNNGLNVDDPLYWQKPSTGSYVYNWVNNTNNYAGTVDVAFGARVRDTLGQYSPVFNYTIKACNGSGSGSGSNFGPASVQLTCNAGNNQTNSVTSNITLPSGAVASDLRILSATVNSWTNNGISMSKTYSYILQASFNGNSLKLDCNQVNAQVTFSIATNQGGNANWVITKGSQLP